MESGTHSPQCPELESHQHLPDFTRALDCRAVEA